jgi:hypothetical protein
MDTPPSASLVRRVWFWVVLVVAAATCAVLSYRLFPRVFPVVSVDIRMDRADALRAAAKLAAEQHWGPGGHLRDVASFGSDGSTQAFIELEGGGKPALDRLLHDDLFSLYAWQVRLFRESETRQVVVGFRPDGSPYSVEETLRENAPGAALNAGDARRIAEDTVRAAPWKLPLDRFNLVESSQVTRPGGRVDHTLVYERADARYGEGRLRLRLSVSGDRLTAVTHFVKVPEAFQRRYAAMRSANTAIGSGAMVAMVLLYLVGGCGVGVFFLLRRRALLWRGPLAWAGVIAGLQLIANLSAWPLAWLGYDTALSATSFRTEHLLGVVGGSLAMGLLLFAALAVAEGLSRLAFPHQPQLLRLWSRDAGASRAVLGRTLVGYLLAAVNLLYVLVFYLVTSRTLGWWSPSSMLVSPDLLAHYWPATTPLANAAQAGLLEEVLFRAIPLAGAALLGARYGGRTRWIAAAFVVQALVFAAAHATYPNQPAYSRLVELLLPSCLFAGLYLAYGLLPAVLLHFTFDVVLMSVPLFAASAPGLPLQRAIVIAVSLAPLAIVVWRGWRQRGWRELPSGLLNSGWVAPAESPAAPIETGPSALPQMDRARLRGISIGFAVVGLGVWAAAGHFRQVGSPLQLGRARAVDRARAELQRREVKLPAGFRADASVAGGSDEMNRFVWRTAGPEVFRAMVGLYLPDSHWNVRFATFTGDVAERAEQWLVGVGGDGQVLAYAHQLPEGRPGATLTEAAARERAQRILREEGHVDPGTLVEVSATSQKRPKRLDWTFVFRDPAVHTLGQGEARISVRLAGEERVGLDRFVFVPEEWQRADRALGGKFRIGSIVKGLVLGGVTIAGLILAIRAWTRRQFRLTVALKVFGAVGAAMLVSFGLQWPATIARFSTAQPFGLQATMVIIGGCLGAFLGGAFSGLLGGWSAAMLTNGDRSARDRWWHGLGAAAAVLAASAVSGLLRGSVGPQWRDIGPAGVALPWLAPGVATVTEIVTTIALLLSLCAAAERFTDGWRRRLWLILPSIAVLLLMVALPGSAVSVGRWLLAAGCSAAVMTVTYWFLLRHDVFATIYAIAIASVLRLAAANWEPAYSGAVFATVVAIGTALGSAVLARRLWLAPARQDPPRPDPAASSLGL